MPRVDWILPVVDSESKWWASAEVLTRRLPISVDAINRLRLTRRQFTCKALTRKAWEARN